MKYSFKSHFASHLENFISQKRALGFYYNDGEYHLSYFDRHCITYFPDTENLTRELCMSWAVKRDTEVSSSFRNRIAPLREFARYLNSLGESAYVINNKYGKSRIRLTPYIYSESEIAEIWNELDKHTPHNNYSLQHLIIPAFVRLLYCCGLRPCEAERLASSEVDLNSGKVYIRESKGHKDRLIMMADDVREYYQDYNEKISHYVPKRQFFFANKQDKSYLMVIVRKVFASAREKLGIHKVGIATPRLYDFRHTFATHRLYRWLNEGKDLNVMLPYLRAYMGHAKLSATYYYLHLVPGQFEHMSGLDFSRYEELLPEVDADE